MADPKWEIVADNLNTHLSESAVKLVAKRSGIDHDLGERGKRGIPQSEANREAFIAHFNTTIAQPLKWTYQGKPLAA